MKRQTLLARFHACEDALVRYYSRLRLTGHFLDIPLLNDPNTVVRWDVKRKQFTKIIHTVWNDNIPTNETITL